MNFKGTTVVWDLQHTLILIGSTIGGAVIGYLESQQPASIIDALQSWTTAKPLVFGALYAALAALLALAKNTFLVPPSVGGGGTVTAVTGPGPTLTFVPTPANDPKPPSAPRIRLTDRFFPVTAVVLALSMTTASTTSCSQAAWAAFDKSAQQFVQYVNSLLPEIQSIWSVILLALGTNGGAANAQFTAAFLDLTSALAALTDGLHAVDAVNQPTPNIPQLMAAVQDAFSRVMAVINQYKTAPSSSLGANYDVLDAQAKTVANWK